MVGMLYVRYMQYTNTKNMYKEEPMLKITKCVQRVVKYVVLGPIMVLEWIMWPVAKVHAGLNSASQWLKKVGQ